MNSLPKHLGAVLSFVTLLMLAFVGPGNANGGPAIDRAGGEKDYIEVVLRADGAPSPGGVATLNFAATPLIEAPNLEIRWILPAGATLLGAESESIGQVSAGQTVRSQRQVRFPEAGTHKVIATAAFEPGPGLRFRASGVLFFTIGGGSRVSDRDPEARSPMGTIIPTEIATSSPLALAPQNPDGDACFTIQGTFSRIDRPSTPGGFGADDIVPVANARVEIREDDDFGGDEVYAELITDANGFYSHSLCDGDGALGGDTLEFYVRLRAELYSGNDHVVEVMDISWIDEVYYFQTGVKESEGGTVTFNSLLNQNQSAVFNVADVLFDAWTFWNASGGAAGDDAVFDDEGEGHWEAGYGEDRTHYTGEPHQEIHIADDPSDPDQWDDSVILHEWGHFADDVYGCDDSPGGPHMFTQILDDELAWTEGYPDYWQSAVRASKGDGFANFYLDHDAGGPGSINLETWDVDQPMLVSQLNEVAIAAAMWDLIDSPQDGQDRVTVSPATLQEVYTSEIFEDIAYGVVDDDCTFDTYMQAWVNAGKPADASTAAAILQNTAYTLPPPGTQAVQSPAFVGADVASAPSGSAPNQDQYSDYIWWDQLTYVVDNSLSMAGSKFNAVTTVLEEAVSDLVSAEPDGIEFTLDTFNNSSSSNQEVFAGQFFLDRVAPAIEDLSTSNAADNNCEVQALRALAEAVDEQTGGEAWLFTDGDTTTWPSVENVTQILNQRDIRASIALMGLCPSVQQAALTDEEAQAQERLHGAAQALLGPAAEELPGGIVPYLLTAINSGGQFLYVDASQAEDAADILRAQISHSAGAGKWSDYVSDLPTYLYDDLATWEYNWIEATSGGTDHGSPAGGSLNVSLPQPFTFYDGGPYTLARVIEDGYLTFATFFAIDPNNTTLPTPAAPNLAIYPLWDDWKYIAPPAGPEAALDDGKIYSKQEGDWFAIQWDGFWQVHANTFQVLLNATTGEIRFQYDWLPDGSDSATIGVENTSGNNGVQISYNDVNGADEEMGYKLTPAPPQPAKTYSVTVDSHMSAVGFLLTGYNGDFEPLAVSYPSGQPVNCADTANVLCLDLGLVQYVQADVDGRYGVWEAVVDAGPSGFGTFSFTTMAASALSVNSRLSDHTLSILGGSLVIDMGQPVAGNVLTGWFQTPANQPFGGNFNLYDDGAHGDGAAGDGLFGSNPYTPPAAGSAYLWVQGTLDGVSFKRNDPVPFNFQPISITSLGDGANFGGATQLQFEVTNHDVHDHCYGYNYYAPEGWWLDNLGGLFGIICINAGQTIVETVDAYLGPGSTNDLPSGTEGTFTLSITELEKGIISDSASAVVRRARPPATIEIYNPIPFLRPGGDTATLQFVVFDEQGVAVADGTEVALSTTLGAISPAVATTRSGLFEATFTSGASEGTAIVTASVESTQAPNAPQVGAISATTEIEIVTPGGSQIALTVTPDNLPADGAATATLVANVLDPFGDPVAGATVRLLVEGDGQMGTINGGEEITGTTNANGRFSATFTSGQSYGQVWLRAEHLVLEDGENRPVHEDRQPIQIGGYRAHMPFMSR